MACLLSALIEILGGLGVPCETGAYKDPPPETYIVLVPIIDDYPVMGDDVPLDEVQEVRISIFAKRNYRRLKRDVEKACINARLCIADRRYIGREDDTGYFHYAIDVAGCYSLEQEE